MSNNKEEFESIELDYQNAESMLDSYKNPAITFLRTLVDNIQQF